MYAHWGNTHIGFEWLGHFAQNFISDTSRRKLVQYATRFRVLHCAMFATRRHEQHTPGGEITSFLALLRFARNLEFNEPRDYIYGLLGVRTVENHPDHNMFLVEADYGISAAECFQKVAETLLLKHGLIEVLSDVRHATGISTDGISWVPDWQYWPVTDRHLSSAWGWSIAQTNTRRPAGISKTTLASQECLNFHGFAFDTISSVGRFASSDTGRCQDGVLGVHIRQVLFRELEEEHGADIFACTLVAFNELEKQSNLPEDVAGVVEVYRDFMQWVPAADEEVIDETDRFSSAVRRFRARFHARIKSRSIIKMRNGLIGLGPGVVEVGDVVVFIFGGIIPYILRPVDGLWRLVGECYVYELRDQCIMKEWEDSDRVAETFSIY